MFQRNILPSSSGSKSKSSKQASSKQRDGGDSVLLLYVCKHQKILLLFILFWELQACQKASYIYREFTSSDGSTLFKDHIFYS
jgi:hypothetical protein